MAADSILHAAVTLRSDERSKDPARSFHACSCGNRASVVANRGMCRSGVRPTGSSRPRRCGSPFREVALHVPEIGFRNGGRHPESLSPRIGNAKASIVGVSTTPPGHQSDPRAPWNPRTGRRRRSADGFGGHADPHLTPIHPRRGSTPGLRRQRRRSGRFQRGACLLLEAACGDAPCPRYAAGGPLGCGTGTTVDRCVWRQPGARPRRRDIRRRRSQPTDSRTRGSLQP